MSSPGLNFRLGFRGHVVHQMSPGIPIRRWRLGGFRERRHLAQPHVRGAGGLGAEAQDTLAADDLRDPLVR